ncbi:MAG: LicD family protein [Mediterranea sp.]|jgi:lipopolysaccharide cholinephosphotransferase|nr:LicD family protein [Mediterranea sp.]
MQYTNNDLQKLKVHLLQIIKEVKRICDEEKIQYFIIGGSALGAVRHSGFIPWDDDFDIGMTRDNYERFLKIAPNKLAPDYFLQWYGTDAGSPFYFAKVRMNGTLFIENYCRNIDMHQGIYIDIFPYDHLPLSKWKRKIQHIKTVIYSELYICKSTTGIFFTQKRNFRFVIKRLTRLILHCFLYPVSKNFLFQLLDNENKRYNDTETKFSSYIKYPFLKILTKDIEFTNSILFEGVLFSCCQNMENYLISHFGENYMQLPPIEMRVNHRPIKLQFRMGFDKTKSNYTEEIYMTD